MNPEKIMPSLDDIQARKNMDELIGIGNEFKKKGGETEPGTDIAKESNREKNFISRKDLPVNAQMAVEIAEEQILDDINIVSEEQKVKIIQALNLRWFSNYQFMNNKLMEWSGKVIAKDAGRNLYKSIRGEAEDVLKKEIDNIEFKEN